MAFFFKLQPNKKWIQGKWFHKHEDLRIDCGVHPSITRYKSCLPNVYPNKTFYFFTFLRNPLKRFISEWKQLVRGAPWIHKTDKNTCLFKNYKKCFNNSHLWQPSLEEFLSCKYNLAINRQTWMLSDRSYECDKKSDLELLAEAKNNLKKLAFFGLTEYQFYSQKLFEEIFEKKLYFITDLQNNNHSFADSFFNEFNTDKTKKEQNSIYKKYNNLYYIAFIKGPESSKTHKIKCKSSAFMKFN
ncbi:heparan-sulfate 6-O-sulfotransferase 2-like isoform X1 [Brachionus plicatilis]|uniref:Heparan-sulfate 6-O-sulfotransferase n=1 Tax=Brachionus plicatilis TaxID=10195 RepID=A0A3M7PSL9_BRAPC|nr:heparan-sulfate 6-O-sulfotransferase 2-like isoform X1 [Brachionus plicatilis]